MEGVRGNETLNPKKGCATPVLCPFLTFTSCIWLLGGSTNCPFLTFTSCIWLAGSMAASSLHPTVEQKVRPLGPGPAFCWVRVRFLETSSSPRPSDFREISGKSVTFFSPSADGPSAMWSRTGLNGREKFRIQSEQSDFWYEPHRCPKNGLDKFF